MLLEPPRAIGLPAETAPVSFWAYNPEFREHCPGNEARPNVPPDLLESILFDCPHPTSLLE
jgi:hypothetical protein